MTVQKSSKLFPLVSKTSRGSASLVASMSESMEYDMENSSLKFFPKNDPESNLETSELQTQSIVCIPNLNLEESCEFTEDFPEKELVRNKNEKFEN